MTLNILDDEIAAKFSDRRTSQFNRLFIPLLLASSLRVIYVTAQYFNSEEDTPIHLVTALLHFSTTILWLILRLTPKLHRWVRVIPPMLLFIECLMSNLSIRHQLPE